MNKRTIRTSAWACVLGGVGWGAFMLSGATPPVIAAQQQAAQQETAQQEAAQADETVAAAADDGSVDPRAVERTRKTIKMLDNIYKQVIVLITDKYVHSESDFAAGSAAVALFDIITESGSHKVRLIDATGDPYDTDNVAQDDFERQAIERLKDGQAYVDKVVEVDGQPHLRALTAVPVVMERCVMCHPHYADVPDGEPIGAISFTMPIE